MCTSGRQAARAGGLIKHFPTSTYAGAGHPTPGAACSGQALRCAAVDKKHGSQAGDEGKDDEQVAWVCTRAPSPPDAPPHLLYRRAQRVAVADVPAAGGKQAAGWA